MICPLEIASDLSALRAARVADHGKHGWLLEGRDGAGDESAGSDFTGDGETDHLVAGGGDRRHERPLDAAVAGTLTGVWLRWAVWSPAGGDLCPAGSGRSGPGGCGGFWGRTELCSY